MNAATKARQAKALAKLGSVVSQPSDWQRRRYDAIIECRDSGLTLAEIGAVLGVTRQAVSQFIAANHPSTQGVGKA